MLRLDHLVISAEKLDDGHLVERQLGVVFRPGGSHVRMGTHNRLLGLGPDYLEVIAVDPERRWLGRPRWFDLDHFAGPPRLTNWVCRTEDLAEMSAHFPGAHEIMEFQRGPFRWRMAVPHDGKLAYDGAFPAFIEWLDGHPAPHLAEDDCRLNRLEIRHPLADELRDHLGPFLADRRLHFTPAPQKELVAEILTPKGHRVLK